MSMNNKKWGNLRQFGDPIGPIHFAKSYLEMAYRDSYKKILVNK